jgi:hypothetical protein
MAIQRKVLRAEIGTNRVRYRVIVTGEECPPHTHEARQHQYLFLQWIAENQAMIQCGYSIPERISISHNGTSWQADCEAEVEEQTT